MQTFNLYLTDLFCGQLNYSYVTKFKVGANSLHGALCKVSKATGLNFRLDYNDIYHSTSKLTGLVIDCLEYPSYDYSEAIEL